MLSTKSTSDTQTIRPSIRWQRLSVSSTKADQLITIRAYSIVDEKLAFSGTVENPE
jgi:hypothetical protein